MLISDKQTFDADRISRVAPAAVFPTLVHVVRIGSLVKAETVVAAVTYDVTAKHVTLANSVDDVHRAVQNCFQGRAFCVVQS